VETIDMGTPLDPAANLTDVMSHRDILPHFDEIAPPEVVTVSQYVGEDEAALLEQLQPKFIIMYDPSPAFVRRVEVHLVFAFIHEYNNNY
jgi:hypothetical protein